MNRSIKFKNNIYLDTSSITHNKILLSDIINNLSPSYMIIGKTEEPLRWSTNDQWNRMSFNKILEQYGNNFALSNSSIKIKSGVKKVRVVAQVIFDISGADANNQYIIMRISQNDVGKAKSISPLLRWGTLHTETILNVKENDEIRCDVIKNAGNIGFYDYTGNFQAGAGCFLLVEKIE